MPEFKLKRLEDAAVHNVILNRVLPHPQLLVPTILIPIIHFHALLYYSITPILHHSITPLLHYSNTPPLHYSITPFLQIGSKTRKAVPLPGSLSTSILPRWASTIILEWNIPMPIPFFLVV